MQEDASPSIAEKSKWQLPRWLWAVFIASLALNFLVIGSLIGMQISGHKHGYGGPRGMHGILRQIPGDQRDEVRSILRKHREVVRPMRKELNRLRREFITYAERETIEPEELRLRLEAVDAQRERVREKLRPMMIELAGKVEPNVRARLLRKLLGQGRRGRRRHRRNN